MTEHEQDTTSGLDAPRGTEDARSLDVEEPRELLLMRAAGRAFAVYADEVETVTPWSRPVPLPHAPASVLGVVAVRGRMMTVLAPTRLLGTGSKEDAAGEGQMPEQEQFAAPASAHHFIASLRGDEQLALGFEHAERFFASHPDLVPAEQADLPVHGTFRHGAETVYLLDPTRLFDAATRGTERRRQRRVSGEP
jgi:hypothetical protein